MSDEDTFVHTGDPSVDDADDPAPRGGAAQPRNAPDPGDAEFDWRGWLLVAVVVVAFLIVPGLLYLLPTARETVAALGLGLRHTYLVLPLLPAFLLGAVAVWSAVRARSG